MRPCAWPPMSRPKTCGVRTAVSAVAVVAVAVVGKCVACRAAGWHAIVWLMRAFAAMALLTHPDKHPPERKAEMEARFMLIANACAARDTSVFPVWATHWTCAFPVWAAHWTCAYPNVRRYEVLSDPPKRALYDARGGDDAPPGSAQQPFQDFASAFRAHGYGVEDTPSEPRGAPPRTLLISAHARSKLGRCSCPRDPAHWLPLILSATAQASALAAGGARVRAQGVGVASGARARRCERRP